LKRRRRRLVSTIVDSTSPCFTHWPFSIFLVLTTPPDGARTSDRRTFWRAMFQAACMEFASAARRSRSPFARFSSSSATSFSAASSTRRW
jgi:hypothetical protein